MEEKKRTADRRAALRWYTQATTGISTIPAAPAAMLLSMISAIAAPGEYPIPLSASNSIGAEGGIFRQSISEDLGKFPLLLCMPPPIFPLAAKKSYAGTIDNFYYNKREAVVSSRKC